MSRPATTYVRTRLVRYAVLAAIAGSLLFVILHNLARLRAMEGQAEALGQVMWVRGGDVYLRDLPKYHQSRRGHLLADPHFEGEPHWYPPMNAWLAAAIASVSGHRGAGAFFRLEVLAVAAALGALFASLYAIGGWVLLAVLPFAAALGWISLGGGLYPNDTARAALLLTIVMIGLAFPGLKDEQPKARWPRRSLYVGFSVGVLGLWNGASFFVAFITWAICEAGALVVRVRCRRGWWQSLRRPFITAAGIALPMSLLLLPQLFRYGKVKMAASARLYLEPFYAGGTDLSAMWELPLLARGLGAWIVVAALLVIVGGRLWRHVAFQRPLLVALPFGVAYFVCIILAHLGYGMHDPNHPYVASLIRRFIPAPPHGFLSVSYGLRLVLVLGAVGLLTATLVLKAAGRWSALLSSGRARDLALGALAAACATICFWIPTDIGFYAQNEDAALLRWARQAKRITRESTVFIQHPGRLVALAGFRAFHFPAPDHSNHYVQPGRQAERDLANHLMAIGDVKGAENVLAAHQVAYFIDPTQGRDPLVQRCSGPPITEHAGFRLLPKVPCH